LAACCSCYGDSDKIIGVLVFSESGYVGASISRKLLKIPTSGEE